MSYISVSDVNQWGSGEMEEYGKVKISLSKSRGKKFLHN